MTQEQPIEKQDELEEILVKYGEQLLGMAITAVKTGGNAPTQSRPHLETAKANIERLIADRENRARIDGGIKALSNVLVYGATGRKHIGVSRSYVVSKLAELQQKRKEIWHKATLRTKGSDSKTKKISNNLYESHLSETKGEERNERHDTN